MAAKIKTIVNPKEKELQVKTTCVIVSRKPYAKPSDEYKVAVVSFYDVNNAHKVGQFPRMIYDFTNVEKVRIKGLNISYYLEGNDLIINDLEELKIIREGNLLIIKGYQFEVERRKN